VSGPRPRRSRPHRVQAYHLTRSLWATLRRMHAPKWQPTVWWAWRRPGPLLHLWRPSATSPACMHARAGEARRHAPFTKWAAEIRLRPAPKDPLAKRSSGKAGEGGKGAKRGAGGPADDLVAAIRAKVGGWGWGRGGGGYMGTT
jgi:hypothetical protein